MAAEDVTAAEVKTRLDKLVEKTKSRAESAGKAAKGEVDRIGQPDVEPAPPADVVLPHARQAAIVPRRAAAAGDLPTLKLPEQVKGLRGAYIKVAATTNGSQVRWYAITPGLNVFPAELLRDSRVTVVSAADDGEYVLLAYTALDDVPSDPEATRVIVGKGGPTPPPGPNPPPPVPPPAVPAPSAEMQALVAPVKAILAGATVAHKSAFSAFYRDFATVLSASSNITSTDTLRAAHVAAGKLAFEAAGIKGVYPGLAAAVDKAIADAVGLESKAMDTATKARAVEVFKALSWAGA